MPQELKSSHKHTIALNVGTCKNETGRSEECID